MDDIPDGEFIFSLAEVGVSLGLDGKQPREGEGGKETNTGESTIAVLKYTQVVEN